MRYIEGVATLRLDRAACTGCTRCTEVCPHDVFAMEDRRARIVDLDACIECGACAKNCPARAISVNPGVGCASAIINSWIRGGEPTCGCSAGPQPESAMPESGSCCGGGQPTGPAEPG